MFEHEVVVAGAGPVGCWLAAELSLAGIDVVVLEKRAERDPHSKALTVLPRTLELLAMRGIADHWLETGIPVPSSHFALMNTRLDFSILDTRYPYVLFFPQARTEALLEERAISLGARVLWKHEVTGVTQDEDGVTVNVETPTGSAVFRARYTVGCEGGSSPVRKSAGIEFVGSPATLRFVMGDVELSEPPEVPTLSLNVDTGALFLVRLGEDVFRVAPFDLVAMHELHEEPPTLEELRASVTRIAGTDYGMHTARWLSGWGNATLHAARYREGRVLVAGDAAHLFPPLGGQGLNLGLQDATNLAWKLAACLHGWAPEGLLETYDDERHPVGAEVVDDTLAQMALVVSSTREGRALRKRFDAMLGTHTSLNRELALRLAGLATVYRPEDEDAHRLTGCRMPDLDLEGASAATAFGLLASAHFVLLDLTGGRWLADAGERADRLDVVTGRLADEERKDWTRTGGSRPAGRLRRLGDRRSGLHRGRGPRGCEPMARSILARASAAAVGRPGHFQLTATNRSLEHPEIVKGHFRTLAQAVLLYLVVTGATCGVRPATMCRVANDEVVEAINELVAVGEYLDEIPGVPGARLSGGGVFQGNRRLYVRGSREHLQAADSTAPRGRERHLRRPSHHGRRCGARFLWRSGS